VKEFSFNLSAHSVKKKRLTQTKIQ